MMERLNTPDSNRKHIAFFGRRNAGKSSIFNLLLNQEISLVSDVPGTTTDPVYKSMELIGYGPVRIIDTAGLDDIRPFVLKQGDMPIYGLPRVIEQLRIRFGYIFATENRYEGAPSVRVTEVDASTPFPLFGQEVIPIAVEHGSLPILGYRIGKLAYITDAKHVQEAELSKLYKVDTLVLNALRKAPHPTHLNIAEAMEIVKEVHPRQAFFTHISQTMGFHAKVQKELPKNVYLAYDKLTIKI